MTYVAKAPFGEEDGGHDEETEDLGPLISRSFQHHHTF